MLRAVKAMSLSSTPYLCTSRTYCTTTFCLLRVTSLFKAIDKSITKQMELFVSAWNPKASLYTNICELAMFSKMQEHASDNN